MAGPVEVRHGLADADGIFAAFDGNAVSGGGPDTVIERREPVVSGEDGLEPLKAANLVTESLEAYAAFVQNASAEPGKSRRSV